MKMQMICTISYESLMCLGWRLANLSITSSMSIGISGWMWRSARLDRRSLLILDLKDVLMRFKPLNDLSAVYKVTGRVQSIVMRALVFEKKLETFGKVWDKVAGRDWNPWVASSDFHFVCQVWISLSSEERCGRSTAYNFPSSITIPDTVGRSFVTKTDGTK